MVRVFIEQESLKKLTKIIAERVKRLVGGLCQLRIAAFVDLVEEVIEFGDVVLEVRRHQLDVAISLASLNEKVLITRMIFLIWH
jgi:hypothetical protein